MSSGNPGNRRLIEVPTGHQLRVSRDALATFQLIAEEVSEMALGSRLPGRLPSFRRLAAREVAERVRRPRRNIDLRSFWADYLLGRDRRFGMQLVTSTAAYRNFMNKQILHLELKEGDRVADLGAGTGDFAVRLAERLGDAPRVNIHEVDHILGALQRGRERGMRHGSIDIDVSAVLADLDLSSGRSVPFACGTFDAALASLLISYLPNPERLLVEVRRILKPGGRLVISSLRKDADISKIYADGMKEFASRTARQQLVGEQAEDFDELARSFLNDASRILDLEEEGRFRFWEPEDLIQMLRRVGFVDARFEPEFGDPPQAYVVRAHRP
jgi:demethylmenaquinone methyltransferase/2-methoxy-6-polyprenyl-1,4-benzoquinol methylase